MTDEKKLPVTPTQARDDGAPAGAPAGPPTDGHPQVEEVPSWRLITTLAVAGTLAGLLIVGVFQWAQPRILEYRATVLRDAIQEVLGGPDEVRTLYLRDGSLAEQAPAGVDTAEAERVFLGYDGTGSPIGFAVTGGQPGFQDVIEIIFGYDPRTEEVLGMRVLESKETPGLGDKIYKDSSFVAGFNGAVAPLRGVKGGEGRTPNDVDMITGATISSETIINTINARVDRLQPMLEDYLGRGGGGAP